MQAETTPRRGLKQKSLRLAQAATSDADELQRALEQERHKAELLARELTITDRLEMLLRLYQARAESSRFKQLTEDEYAEQRKSLQQERARLNREAESGAAELCQALRRGQDDGRRQAAADSGAAELRNTLQRERDRSNRLEHELALAKSEVAKQTASPTKANDEATQAKQAASDVSELRKSLQQEQEHASQLAKDLAAARQEVETQTALTAKANDDATKVKQTAESDVAKAKTSLQQEQEHASQLAKDLAAVRREAEMQRALTAKANDDATKVKQTAKSDVAKLKTSLQQEQEHASQLAKDLAAARQEAETQTALAAKANAETGQMKVAAANGCTELGRSLQAEHERAESLSQDLSKTRAKLYAYEAQAQEAGDETKDREGAAEGGAADLRKSLQQERERADHLTQDLAAARHDVEAQIDLATKAREDAVRSKQATESGNAELQRSLRKEHDRAEALAQNLSLVHATIYAYEAQTRKVASLPPESRAAELQKSLIQAWERTARVEKDLAVARHDLETRTALAAKADAETARLRQVAGDSVELRKSLQQERDRAAQMERELASERKAREASTAVAASKIVTSGQVTQDKHADATQVGTVANDHATAGAARGDARPGADDVAEIARLLAHARVLLGRGDIGSARIVLDRAVERGSAQASFTLAETFDPLVLRKWGAYGTRGDAVKARALYAKAQAGGISAAKERLDALGR